MKHHSTQKDFTHKLLFPIEVETTIHNLSISRRQALSYQVEAVRLVNNLQILQVQGFLSPRTETLTLEKISQVLEQAAHYLSLDNTGIYDALACTENAKALRSNNWELLKQVYLQYFEYIWQPVIIAPIPAMHNHSMLWSGFVAVVSEDSMESGLKINHHSQLFRLNLILYPKCPVRTVKTRFAGAHVIKATNIHHSPYFIPEYFPEQTDVQGLSVGYLLNTYTAQSVSHTLCALEPFWVPDQLDEIRHLFESQDANQVQAALISLHNMTHFLGSQPMTHPNKKNQFFMQGADEEFRADSGSNLGLDALGNELFDRPLIQAVILMDILDRAFKYILAAPRATWEKLLVSHHDVTAGQMRLNALRYHGALKQEHTKKGRLYYLDYEKCLESDRNIINELEELDRLGLTDGAAYQSNREKILSKYLRTNEEQGWLLDYFYDQVYEANPWLSAQLVFDYPVEFQLLMEPENAA
ncbi:MULTISPECIES: hypothetical protein [unclassified Microcoleus]|uniref:hypothetical protein n=1 Tax=unclassified Microcoleus TaxID=2642155 RepID=UPI002FD11B98